MDDINYAILEQNGKITVIKNADSSPITAQDLGIKLQERGIMHILVSNGYINHHNLGTLNKDPSWLSNQLKKEGCAQKDIFLYMMDDSGKSFCIKKERK